MLDMEFYTSDKEGIPKMPSFHTLLRYWYLSRGIVRGVFHSGPSGFEGEVVD